MISPIDAIQSTATKATDTGTSMGADKLGKDDFLKIFLAQVQYQDPMDPMKGTEYTAQLAQFSSLEQLFNVNDNLESINAVTDKSNQFDVLGFMGKDIVAKGDQVYLDGEGKAEGAFRIGSTAGCTVRITDASGNLIRNIPIGRLDAGQHNFEWDGLNESGSRMTDGTFRFTVQAVDEAGNPIPADTLIRGKVTKVNMEGEAPILYAEGIAFHLEDVREIRNPSELDNGLK